MTRRGLSFALALAAASAIAAYYLYQKKTINNEEEERNSRLANLPPALKAAFTEAAARIRERDDLTDGELLVLYALYKQTMYGDAPKTMPLPSSWNLVVEQAKYSAWSHVRGMSAKSAAEHYLEAVEKLDSTEPDEGLSNGFSQTVSRPEAMSEGQAKEDNISPEGKLLRAAEANDVITVVALLDEGVDVDHTDETGQTALHLASDKGSYESVEALLKRKANPKATDRDGISVLQAAVIAGHVEVCKLLLQYGADPDQADADGDTPRACAQDDGSTAMKTLFEEATENDEDDTDPTQDATEEQI